jgi:hypothetical protein
MLRLKFNSGDFLSFEKHRHRVPNVSLFFVSISLCTASATRSITLAAPILYSSCPTDLQTIPRHDARGSFNAHHLCAGFPLSTSFLALSPVSASLFSARTLLGPPTFSYTCLACLACRFCSNIHTAPQHLRLLFDCMNMTNSSVDSVKDGIRLASSLSLLQGPASLRPGHWDIR